MLGQKENPSFDYCCPTTYSNHLDTAPDGDGEGDEDEKVGDKGEERGHTAVVLPK